MTPPACPRAPRGAAFPVQRKTRRAVRDVPGACGCSREQQGTAGAEAQRREEGEPGRDAGPPGGSGKSVAGPPCLAPAVTRWFRPPPLTPLKRLCLLLTGHRLFFPRPGAALCPRATASCSPFLPAAPHCLLGVPETPAQGPAFSGAERRTGGLGVDPRGGSCSLVNVLCRLCFDRTVTLG